MSDLRKTIGNRIRVIRKIKGLTQQQLVELSNLDDAYIGAIERGERNFSVDTPEKIMVPIKNRPMELFQGHDDLSEVETAQHRAIDEYAITVRELSAKQTKALKRIVGGIRKAFED